MNLARIWSNPAIIALICIGLCPITSNALDLAIVGTANFSTLSYGVEVPSDRTADFTQRYNAQFGWGGGVVLTSKLGEMTGLEGGLQFVRRKLSIGTAEYGPLGSANSAPVNNAAGEVILTANYLQIPILFRFFPTTTLSFGLGPYVGYGIGSIDMLHKRSTVSVSTSPTFKEFGIKNLDAGIAASFVSYFPVGKSTSIFVDLRYLAGLLNTANLESVASATDIEPSAKFGAFQVLLGVNLGKIGKLKSTRKKRPRRSRSRKPPESKEDTEKDASRF